MLFFSDNAFTINKELESYFQNIAKDAHLPSFEREIMADIAEFTLRGGKRIRASLVYVGFKLALSERKRKQATSPELKKVILDLGVAMEIIQSFFLIHDDIIDKSPLRRGKPTLHTIWGAKFSNDLHIGESFGILAGNFALVKAFEIIQKLQGIDESRKLQILSFMTKVIEDTLAGQTLDVMVSLKTLDET